MVEKSKVKYMIPEQYERGYADASAHIDEIIAKAKEHQRKGGDGLMHFMNGMHQLRMKFMKSPNYKNSTVHGTYEHGYSKRLNDSLLNTSKLFRAIK